MKFENSEYYKNLKHSKLEMSFGNYYLCDNFVIGELNEGVHFDWEKAKETVDKKLLFMVKRQKLVLFQIE